jgi:hypothetical protein
MSQASLISIDSRVLKEDYRNYDLIARYWNDEYRGRIWKNKQRVADCEGADLDEIMAELKAMVDQLQADKRRQRGRRKLGAGDLAEALRGIEPKLSRAQKMMLSLQSRATNHSISVKSLMRLGEYGTEGPAFEDYLAIGRRLADELAYNPSIKRKGASPAQVMLLADLVNEGRLAPETVLVMRADLVSALETLGW